MAEPETRTTNVGSSVQFKVEYEQSKQVPMGTAVHSNLISAGGHLWMIKCYPHGDKQSDKGEFISIFFVLKSKSRSVMAKFEVSVIGRDGKPSVSDMMKGYHIFPYGDFQGRGWSEFLKRTTVEEKYLTGSHITFLCTILVIDDDTIPVPPSDIGTHLGRMLDHTDGADVSFIVDDETFPAHRAVLAVRSPVFRAELFGSMSEATMSTITLQEITPATFKVLLRFIYTDELPAEDDPEGSSIDLFQNLLAAADRYALDRLKFICAKRLWAEVSVDTVASILASAETYNCQELKNKCIDFFVRDENFKEAIFTDGYVPLVLKFPSIAADLKRRIKA